MRKILVVLVLLMVMTLASCGMGWENFKKDFKSNVGGGLERVITVTNMFTGEVIWEYEGVAYIRWQSSSGDVTVVYYGQEVRSKRLTSLVHCTECNPSK